MKSKVVKKPSKQEVAEANKQNNINLKIADKEIKEMLKGEQYD